MTPDQNPHPLTDHDGHAPHGETPMPLVDGVALRGPGPATPPPLFRPREEAEKPAVGEASPGEGAFGDPAPPAEAIGGPFPESDAVGDLFPAAGAFGDSAPVPNATGDPFPATGAAADSAPAVGAAAGPDPLPETDAFSDLPPAASAFGDPAPESGPTRDPAPESGAFSDPFPAAGAFGAAAPESDLTRDLAPESGAISDPFPTADATGDPASAAGAAADQIPTADTIADQASAPALSSAVNPVPSPDPGLPLQPDRPDHPGRSLHLEAGAPHVRPVGPGSPAVSDGPAHFRPVRRSRTEPSAEWTPLPSYGEEAGPRPDPPSDTRADSGTGGPDGGAATPSAGVDDPGPGPELDLVLDLAPGARATSATFSVPAPYPPPHPRRHSVIANESTASIPVHLLFRDDPETPEPTALPPAVGRTARRSDTTADRTPRPRSPHPRVEPPTRPAPLADPRLAERPGPALSGYAALLTGAAGILGVLAVLWWRGALPAAAQSAVGLAPRPYEGIGAGAWALLALLVTVVVLALGGLGRGRVGYAWVLTLFGDYRGSVRRTGLVWVSPLLLRRRVDVRLRHWRSEPLPAVDANGTALRVVVLVVWRIKDTVRAALGIEDHEAYLSAQVESAMARVLSQLPADAFHEDAPTLRNAEAVGDALTRMLKADCEPVGVEVYSAQPTGIEYAPEVAAAMQRRRIAAIDAKHRDSVLTSVVDAVDDTVNRLTTRGIVDLDDYERKALVKDLTVAFYTGRSGTGDGA
ncbi:SPFH domain-containing protein [Streptomyces sp. BE282]|uniref:SPFH domain-containing protein n=1 Tax=Streptomyces sp. BE282 TaxID=3002527 RepID=UPI002E777811|nr:SPFH domain-containing protein [Streptomyces sp. BE282]MEE1731781.1 SPFH domain-containing protein [Streptomyces sp. BE282]